MSKLTANEMMVWGLTNLWKEGHKGGYSVRHGCCSVNDFGRPRQELTISANAEIDLDWPNFFEKAYPGMFPFGCGGNEADQHLPVKYHNHIKWALQHFDHCFCKHEMFPFVTFGISQCWNALGSAQVQMQWKCFEHDACIMAQIMMKKLEQAQREEEQHLPISDPTVCLLKTHVHTTAGCIMGSDQSHFQMCSHICINILRATIPLDNDQPMWPSWSYSSNICWWEH